MAEDDGEACGAGRRWRFVAESIAANNRNFGGTETGDTCVAKDTILLTFCKLLSKI
jgi:hypothetical protein